MLFCTFFYGIFFLLFAFRRLKAILKILVPGWFTMEVTIEAPVKVFIYVERERGLNV